MQNTLIYSEKQYLGHNRISAIIRIVLALLCFLGYYWSENPKPVEVSGIHIGSYPVDEIPASGHIFFVLGILILLLSAILMYVLHIQTQVYPTYILISGFWGARKVKIDFSNIHTVKKMRYKKNIFRRPVYNLYIKEIVKFYTSGDSFVELKDKDGFTYRIGTQRPHELFKLINYQVNNF